MDKLRWRVEHRNKDGDVLNILQTAKHVDMERHLCLAVRDQWLLAGGDTIHIIRQTEE